jgi:hypothetical protein
MMLLFYNWRSEIPEFSAPKMEELYMLSLRGFTYRTIVLTLFLLPTAMMAQHRHTPGQFLTGPQEGTPEEIVLNYIRTSAFADSFTGGDLTDIRINAEVPSAKGTASHVYFNQFVNGIEVYNAILNATVMNDGRILNIGNRLVNQTSNATSARAATLTALDAIGIVSSHLGVAPALNYRQIQTANGAAQAQLFAGENLSSDDIPVRLKYFPVDGELRLTWFMVVNQENSLDWWEILVDSVTGEVLHQYNYTIYENFRSNAYAPLHQKSTKVSSLHEEIISKNRLVDGSAYFVVPLGIESPSHGDLALVTEPADAVASPFGWHDTDGVAGPEFTITRGNNVHAFNNRDGDDSSNGDEPDGGGELQFNIMPDFNENPINYTDAAVVNLFYWNNIVHNIMVHYGFDEASGNFQQTNYSGQGSGGDYVRAHAQSGANFGVSDNATFGTPPDGFRPEMNMFVWRTEPHTLEISSPGSLEGSYGARGASFGLFIPEGGLAGQLELVSDGTSAEGCNALVGFTPGRIAVIDRGSCQFGTKVLNAENAGAIGAIILNNGGNFVTLGPGDDGGAVTIPAIHVDTEDANLIREALLGGETVTVNMIGGIRTDSDYDSGIIAHEYGHGISNRLVGGPSTASCLNGSEQGGEGWSDFYALALTPGDGTVRDRGVGTYPLEQPTDGGGIREFPYSPNLEINPVTYSKIADGNTTVPHGVGHVLNTVMWDLYWNLVDEVGYDPDLYTGTGGNNIAIMLVTEGLKVSPCNPTFVDYRDAVLAADQALYEGQFNCLIWRTFARRGLGENAIAGTANRGDETEDFTVPESCACSPFTINNQPQSDAVCTDSNVDFTVTVSGSGMTFQWYKDGEAMVGETAETLSLTAVTSADAGSYTCVITNACDEQTTAPAVLEVSDPPSLTNEGLAQWGLSLSCGDVNGNNRLDVQDLVGLVQ